VEVPRSTTVLPSAFKAWSTLAGSLTELPAPNETAVPLDDSELSLKAPKNSGESLG
jgi:hypothetical protein